MSWFDLTKKDKAEIDAREEKRYRAMERRIEKKDRNAVERYLRAFARADRKELRKWDKEFAKD